MPYDIPIILLPLLGGYLILSKSIFFLQRYNHVSSQRLLFDSLIAAILLFFATYLIRDFAYYFCKPAHDSIYKIIRCFLYPHDMKLIGTASISFIFASIFAYLPNRAYKRYFPIKRNRIYARAIRRYGDELDNIFFSGLLGGKLIQITLKNGKVYIGFVIEVGGPKTTNYIAMLPLLSGYRETENKILWITTTYEEVINAIICDEKLPLNDFKIVMNQNKILVASFFDSDIYDKFQEQMENKKPQQTTK